MVHIDSTKFKSIIIDNFEYEHDLYVHSSGWIDVRLEKGLIKLREIDRLCLKLEFDYLILGYGLVGLHPFTEKQMDHLSKLGAKIITETTSDAAKTFNKLEKEGKRVLAILHVSV